MNAVVMRVTEQNELLAGNVGVLALKINIPNCTKYVPRRYARGQANEGSVANEDEKNEAATEDKGGCREGKRRK